MDGKAPTFSQLRFLSGPLLLGVLCASLLLTRLSCPLLEPEESRYAEIPRQMLAEGRFIEPVLHGQPYYHKPPLLYWLVMCSYCIFGVHDWAARLVPALASVGTVLVAWLWGRRVFGPRIGLAGAVVLILSGRFIYLGRMLTIDPLLTLWVTAALAAAHLAVREGPLRWRWWLASALLTGLGLLTKGPVALVLTLVPVVLFQMLERRSTLREVIALLWYLVVAASVAGPWYIAMALRNPEAAGDFFVVHNVQRYLDPVDHEEPIWFFLPSLLLGTLPWSLLLVPLIRWLWRRPASFLFSRDAQRNAFCPSPLRFALLSLTWCVIFFSLSGCKRAVYILPALPWLAQCLGFCISAAPWRGLRWRPGPKVCKTCAAVVFVVLLVGVHQLLPSYHRRFAMRGQVRRHLDAGMEVVCYPKRWDSVTFYLQRTDVRVFASEDRDKLIARLHAQPGTLLFVKRPWLDGLLRALPADLEFVALGRQSDRVHVGVVRPRQDLLLASRQRKLPG